MKQAKITSKRQLHPTRCLGHIRLKVNAKKNHIFFSLTECSELLRFALQIVSHHWRMGDTDALMGCNDINAWYSFSKSLMSNKNLLSWHTFQKDHKMPQGYKFMDTQEQKHLALLWLTLRILFQNEELLNFVCWWFGGQKPKTGQYLCLRHKRKVRGKWFVPNLTLPHYIMQLWIHTAGFQTACVSKCVLS